MKTEEEAHASLAAGATPVVTCANTYNTSSPPPTHTHAQAAKEEAYARLTAGGIRAFEGAADLIKEAQRLGMAVAVASSGAPLDSESTSLFTGFPEFASLYTHQTD